jgi:hypothetical protein
MDTHNHSAEHIENPDVAHETSDVSVRGILGFGIGLAVGTGVVALLLFGAFSVMVQRFNPPPAVNSSPLTRSRPVVPESRQHAVQTFPEPRLQTNNVEDLTKFREEEYRYLQSYGWVDPNAGVVHIPIEQAKELLLKQGLPVRTPGAVPPAAPPPAPAAATTGAPAPTAAQAAGLAAQPAASQQPVQQKPPQQKRQQPKPQKPRQR